ncbi:MAG: type II toxin-antitoxin system RelE/ParE family toxin [Hyphomicrobiaceae bacterium]|nr:type II toxin-antitoxin system RelE/ParE family toxin [Hyphomicrobiaceae bacterium]
MLDPRRIRHKGLRLLFERGEERRLNLQWVPRIKRILAALNIAGAPDEIDTPGSDFHELVGNRKGTYSVTVTRNWRLTFEWDSEGPLNVDLEDYHGR